jgi:aminoglycoside phosphotransferase (APT) family kinase protein
MSETPPEKLQKSSRDLGALRDRLVQWLSVRLGEGSDVVVSDVSTPSTTGMSSETLLFDARWREGATRRSGSFVARVAPDPGDVPVFPKYDLELQYRVLRLVGEHSDVPVPRVRWLELDEAPLGAPFFVMDRVEGRVLASLHSIDVNALDTAFLELDVPGATALRRHVEGQRRYYDWVRGERRFPLLERTFDWLQANWPAGEGRTVISWGDSRIGNILYDGFTPVAVLDWEMASLGPPGIDLGWCIFLHDFFEDITHRMGMPGMPHFMRREDVAAAYEQSSGRPLSDLRFFEVYAALRHGIVMTRVHARRVHFEGAEWPEDLDAAIMHRELLEQMLEGKFPR